MRSTIIAFGAAALFAFTQADTTGGKSSLSID